MIPASYRVGARLGGAALVLLLTSTLARAEAPTLDEGACGLEPPGVEYLPVQIVALRLERLEAP